MQKPFSSLKDAPVLVQAAKMVEGYPINSGSAGTGGGGTRDPDGGMGNGGAVGGSGEVIEAMGVEAMEAMEVMEVMEAMEAMGAMGAEAPTISAKRERVKIKKDTWQRVVKKEKRLVEKILEMHLWITQSTKLDNLHNYQHSIPYVPVSQANGAWS